MVPTDKDLLLLAETAIAAAKQAGKLISEYTDHQIQVESKTGGDSEASQVVTEVDLLSQGNILKTIIPTCKKFDLALLTEESADDHSRLEKEYFWCIDPLDGTLPFIESTPGYSVSIALVSKDGTPQIGVVYDPLEHNLYHAVKGNGAYRNGKPWQRKESSTSIGKPLSFITDRSFTKHNKFDQIFGKLESIAKDMDYKGVELIKHGGAVMNACWVLENAPACYFKFPKPQAGGGSLWDYAATACIFTEIGAPASDIHGNLLDLNRHDSTFMNHRGVLYASEKEIAERVKRLFTSL